jgi:predicted molibdopterin-dependent oxidoreductase YjgC
VTTPPAIPAGLLRVHIDGEAIQVAPGTTVAAALLNSGGWKVRRSVAGEARGPLCGMGTCYECRATIDGVAHERSCMVLCRDGMAITTDFLPELQAAPTPSTDPPPAPREPAP